MMKEFASLSLKYNRSLKTEAHEKRMENIRSFRGIDRDGLEYGIKERIIELKEYETGEHLYIQLPGKETKNPGAQKRPWDFRPKLMKKDGVFITDLSFKDIWNDIEGLRSLGNSKDVLSIIAAVFFRMALMIGYIKENRSYSSSDIILSSGETCATGNVLLSWYSFAIDKKVILYLKQNGLDSIRGVSLEPYLAYNDLLAQNEDCKYYYRDVCLSGGNKWNSFEESGRYNTLMSHISLIDYITDGMSFSEIMDRFQHGRGVAPSPLNALD
jgi:hypothetical protein